MGPNSWNSGPARTKPDHQPGERRRLEPCDGLAPQDLVGSGREGDEPEDRRHGGGGRGALEEAGEGDDREADGERGDDHGDGAEPRSEQHDPAVADAVGEDPEQRRGDELGRVEQGAEDADGARVDRLAAVLRERGVVVDEHRARDPGRESQRERAEDDREDGTRHARKRSRYRAAAPCSTGVHRLDGGPYHRAHPEPASRRGPTEERTVSHVAIVTDSASDLPPDAAAAQSITVVPLVVSFGPESFRPNVDLTTDAVLGADDRARRPVPDHRGRVARRLQDGLRGRIRIGGGRRRVRQRVGRPVGNAEVGPGRSRPARGPRGPRHRLADGVDGRRAARPDRRRAGEPRALPRPRSRGSSSSARPTSTCSSPSTRSSTSSAAAGSAERARRSARCSSIKPIITVQEGIVENADRVRSRQKARERVLELLTAKPLERAAILHSTNADVDEFREQFIERSGLDRVEGPDDADRAVRRAAPGPGLRRRGDHLQALTPRLRLVGPASRSRTTEDR